MLADPMLNPPALTLAVLWQPEPLQSRLPVGMWLPGVVVILMLANVPATVGRGQFRRLVTLWCVAVTEKAAWLPAVVWHGAQIAVVGMTAGNYAAYSVTATHQGVTSCL